MFPQVLRMCHFRVKYHMMIHNMSSVLLIHSTEKGPCLKPPLTMYRKKSFQEMPTISNNNCKGFFLLYYGWYNYTLYFINSRKKKCRLTVFKPRQFQRGQWKRAIEDQCMAIIQVTNCVTLQVIIGIGIKYTLHWCCRVLHRQFAIVTVHEGRAMQLLHLIATGAKPFPKHWTGEKVLANDWSRKQTCCCCQDYFSTWHMIFAVSDQKTKRIVELMIKKVRPLGGVLEVVVTDRGNKRFMSSDVGCLV